MTAENAALAQEEPATDAPNDAPASGEQSIEAPAEPPAEAPPAEGEQAAEGEEGKAPEKAPEKERNWAQVAAAKKAQVQVAQARQKLEHDVSRVRAYEGELQQREQRIEHGVRQLQEREARLRPLEEALASRDLNKLISLGFDYDAYTREALVANTPEGIARRAQEETKKLREQLEAKDRQALQAEQHRQQVQETRSVAQKLVELVDGGADDYPELYVWAPERIAQEGLELRDHYYRQHGRAPTFGVVLDALQKRAKQEAEVHTQRSSALKQRKSANPSDAGSAGKVDAKGASGSPGTPALTNATANQRATPPREQTEAEIEEWCLQQLRGLKR
jgi:hypothetical protein